MRCLIRNPEAARTLHRAAEVLPGIIGCLIVILYLTPWIPAYNQIQHWVGPSEFILVLALIAVAFAWFKLKNSTHLSTGTVVVASCIISLVMAVTLTAIRSNVADNKILCLNIVIPIIMGCFVGIYSNKFRNLPLLVLICSSLWVISAEYLSAKANVDPRGVINSAVDPLDFRLILVAAFPMALLGAYSAQTVGLRIFYTVSTLLVLIGVLCLRSFLGSAICISFTVLITYRYVKSLPTLFAVTLCLAFVAAVSCGQSLIDPITGHYSSHLFENRYNLLKADMSFEYRVWIHHASNGIGPGYLQLPMISSTNGYNALVPTSQLLWSGLCLGVIGILIWSLIGVALLRNSILLWRKGDQQGVSLSCLGILLVSFVDAFFGLPDRPIGGFLVPFLGIATCVAAQRPRIDLAEPWFEFGFPREAVGN